MARTTHPARQYLPPRCHLLGMKELAEFLAVPAQNAKNWHRRGKLPPPVAELASGPVWTDAQIRDWRRTKPPILG